MLKGIAFDFDGVILESVDIKTRAFKELFKEYPEHVDKIVRLHLNNTGMSRFEKIKIIYAEYLGRPTEDGELRRLGDAFSRFVYGEILRCPFVPGAYEFLEKHWKQYEMFIVSATPEDEIRDIVKRRELERFFEGVYGSPCQKDEILQGILRGKRFRPREIVFIGDAVNDYHNARKVFVPFIGREPKGEPYFFDREGVITIVEDLYELEQQWDFVLEKLQSQ